MIEPTYLSPLLTCLSLFSVSGSSSFGSALRTLLQVLGPESERQAHQPGTGHGRVDAPPPTAVYVQPPSGSEPSDSVCRSPRGPRSRSRHVGGPPETDSSELRVRVIARRGPKPAPAPLRYHCATTGCSLRFGVLLGFFGWVLAADSFVGSFFGLGGPSRSSRGRGFSFFRRAFAFGSGQFGIRLVRSTSPSAPAFAPGQAHPDARIRPTPIHGWPDSSRDVRNWMNGRSDRHRTGRST